MGHRHDKSEILDGALAVAFADGLSQLSFGRVAKHLGISDRVVVYYFPSKDELVSEVLLALGTRLMDTLVPVLSGQSDDHRTLVRAAWPVLATEAADPVFALFFEANGLAAAGREPYRAVVTHLVEVWVEWTAGYVTGPTARRRGEAEAAIAVLDGLLLLRQLGGPTAANRAARLLGVR